MTAPVAKHKLKLIPDLGQSVVPHGSCIDVYPQGIQRFRDVLTSGSLILGMSFGKAAIAPRLGCAADLAEQTAGGFYDPADSYGLASALRDFVLHADAQDTGAMGAADRALAHAQRWSVIADRTRQIYEQALGSNCCLRPETDADAPRSCWAGIMRGQDAPIAPRSY